MFMKKAYELLGHLKPGSVYRRDDLAKWSNAVDRHISELLEGGMLEKLGAGLYLRPKQSTFGSTPPSDTDLVAAFLKDNRFLITSYNAYNQLGVGTTQLYNETIVYNHKRHGRSTFKGRSFDFRRKAFFPKKVTEEFLLVDLVNNIDQLAEDKESLLGKVQEKANKLESKSLKRISHEFGTVSTRKFFDSAISKAS